jgi:hypothetical protein
MFHLRMSTRVNLSYSEAIAIITTSAFDSNGLGMSRLSACFSLPSLRRSGFFILLRRAVLNLAKRFSLLNLEGRRFSLL